jgi:hypothetical protein
LTQRMISHPLLTLKCLTRDSKSSDPDDCFHHINKVSTSIQMFSIFIISLIITN